MKKPMLNVIWVRTSNRTVGVARPRSTRNDHRHRVGDLSVLELM
jgi:hypothetical protein